MVLISGITILLTRNTTNSNFSLFWVIWMIWMFFIIALLRINFPSRSTIWSSLFSPMIFLFCYSARKKIDKTSINFIFIIGFVVLFGLAFYINLKYMNYREIEIGEEMVVTNLVFWCLCATPFFFIVSRRWLQMVLLLLAIIIVLLTYKRSANICMGLIVFFYFIHLRKTTKRNLSSSFMVLLGILVGFFVISNYFSNAFSGVRYRMSTIQSTQGTGRIPIYHAVINVLKTNDFIDWFLGRGAGSIRITRHTNAHNDALQMLFEFGIVGLVLYIVLLWNIIKRTRILRRIKSSYYFGYLVSLVIFVVLGFVSNLVVFYSYFSFICAYWGLAEYEITQNNLLNHS